MKIIVLLVIGFILYLIAKNYKTEKFKNINIKFKENFEGDLLHHEAGLLVALMAKVAKADGKVCELEAELLKNTLNDISRHFENNEEIRNRLKDLYEKEKQSFDNTVELSKNLYNLTKNDYSKRLGFIEYLLNLAFIDKDFSNTERMILEDISDALQVRKNDFENLVNTFKSFYAQSAKNDSINLEKAYKILEIKESDDVREIKQKYRSLVKKHHPDIIAGQGASQNIIDKATKKLQEINEAYELIKSHKGM